MVKVCPRCGYQNIDGATVCARCGYQFPQQSMNLSFGGFSLDKKHMIPVILTNKELIIKDTSIPLSSIINVNLVKIRKRSTWRIAIGIFMFIVASMDVIFATAFGVYHLIYASVVPTLLGITYLSTGSRIGLSLVNITYQGGQISLYNKIPAIAESFVKCANNAKMGIFNCK
jgi:hypothetical protein